MLPRLAEPMWSEKGKKWQANEWRRYEWKKKLSHNRSASIMDDMAGFVWRANIETVNVLYNNNSDMST